ncbi:MAG: hypothetical protein JWQ42_4504 [Edaphobacter sp.]|jgi:hypothetical protein|nr:hypothetical protein [Edaphobacter sp.]
METDRVSESSAPVENPSMFSNQSTTYAGVAMPLGGTHISEEASAVVEPPPDHSMQQEAIAMAHAHAAGCLAEQSVTNASGGSPQAAELVEEDPAAYYQADPDD